MVEIVQIEIGTETRKLYWLRTATNIFAIAHGIICLPAYPFGWLSDRFFIAAAIEEERITIAAMNNE